MTTIRDDAGPAQHHLDEATSTARTTTDQGNGSTVDYTAEQPDADVPDWPPRRDWSGERTAIVDALALAVGPRAGASPFARLLVHLLALHDRCARAEWVCWDRARQDEEARLMALREASHATSAAVDWSAASRRPSHAELVRRRAVVA